MMTTNGKLGLLENMILRLDLLYEPDVDAALLQEDQDMLARRAAREQRNLLRDNLSPVCLRILVDDELLQAQNLDLADLQEEIELNFKDHFEILRSTYLQASGHARLRLRPVCPTSSGRLRSARAPSFSPLFPDRFVLYLKHACKNLPSLPTKPQEIYGLDLDKLQSLPDSVWADSCEDFFLLLREHTWVRYPGLHKLVASTDPRLANRAEELVYDLESRLLEPGSRCQACPRFFLPRQLSQDTNASGYCLDCFGDNFCHCYNCSVTTRATETAVLDCGCKYCQPCFAQHFTAGLSQQAFPPRCCSQPIDIIKYRRHIPEEALKEYARRIDQFTDGIRLHCAEASCGQWIKPILIKEGWGLCGACTSVTCQHCRKLEAMHGTTLPEGRRQCPIIPSPGRTSSSSIKSSSITTMTGMAENGTNPPNGSQIYDTHNGGPPHPRHPDTGRLGSTSLQQYKSTGAGLRSPCLKHIWKRAPRANSCNWCQRRPLFGYYVCEVCKVCVCWTCERGA